MTDLDTALRTMLRERGTDIDSLPADFNDLTSLDVLDRDPILDLRRSHRTGWLIAAAVIAVLAVVGATVGLRHGSGSSDKKINPATHSASVVHSTPPPSPNRPQTPSTVDLAWFGMRDLPGYQLGERASEPGFRQLAIKPKNDPDRPAGSNGGSSSTAYITVYNKGQFDATQVDGWPRVAVGTKSGYLGTLAWVRGEGDAHTLAWQYGSGEWAIVQGLTPATSSAKSLAKIARAVRPTVSIPIGLPFRLDYVPGLPVTEVKDDRADGYAFTLTFGDTGQRSLEITLWTGSLSTYFDTKGMIAQTIGSLIGYYDPKQGAGVQFHGGSLLIDLNDDDVGVSTNLVDQEMLDVLDGLHWANGDGSAPLIPAEQAIP
jgi:hypothetical protein